MEVAAVILAGGQSRRFGQLPKAMANLGGTSLIERVIGRLSPQVTAMAIGVDVINPLFNSFGLHQVEDPSPGSNGPLPALMAGLKWVRDQGQCEWLQLAPCDSPFLPDDLVGRLLTHTGAKNSHACVPRLRGELQPACGLWHVSLYSPVEQAVGSGLKGFKQFLDIHPASVLNWPEPAAGSPDPFFNINTPAHLQEAQRSI